MTLKDLMGFFYPPLLFRNGVRPPKERRRRGFWGAHERFAHSAKMRADAAHRKIAELEAKMTAAEHEAP